jgi:LuxR family maltose regulon positive regulatory protein
MQQVDSKPEQLMAEITNVLIATKMQPPRLTADYIPRPRLHQRLERDSGLVLVLAPAGYGKSTLLSSWIETLDRPAAWLSLDVNDDDQVLFLSYLIGALQVIFPEFGLKTLAIVNASETPQLNHIATSLINELNSIDQAFILVIDDYHLIKDRQIHKLITMILEHSPQNLQLVLSSRIDPPLPLANLRARGGLIEVRAHDLRFNQTETAGLVEKLVGEPVDKATANLLEERSEGWVTGLLLAVLSQQHMHQQVPDFRGLQVDNRLVTDYLMSVVFAQQAPIIQQFLVQISILDRFNAQLCAAICAPSAEAGDRQLPAGSFLEQIARSNLFLIPLDQTQSWYRFHHLFQNFLRQQLHKRLTVTEINALHNRASSWLAENSFLEDAFQHALNAETTSAAIEIIEHNRSILLDEDKWPTIGRWLARLPEQIVQQRPRLLLAQAWVHYFRFALGAIPPLLQRIETLLADEPEQTVLVAEVNFFWGNHWYWLEENERSLHHLELALKYLPVNSHQGQAEGDFYYALVRYALGQKEIVIPELRQRLHYENLSDLLSFRLFGALIFIHILSGDAQKALQVNQQMADAVAPTNNRYIRAWTFYLDGFLHFGNYNLAAAIDYFDLAVENRYALHTRVATDTFAGLALAYQHLGQTDRANRMMADLLEFALQQNDPAYASIAQSLQARLWLLKGDLESATRWQAMADMAFDTGRMFYFIEVPRITLCRVLIAEGTPGSLLKATRLLTGYLQNSQAQHNIWREIEVSILLAVAYEKQGRHQPALDLLKKALILSRPGAIIQHIVEVGSEVAGLVAELLAQGVTPPFLKQILEAIQATVDKPASPDSDHQPVILEPKDMLIEQLTRREFEVLTLLMQDLTNREIANTLTISIHTVKRHTANIYRKLAVNNRRQAVSRAKSLGISISTAD